ncbi:hypothetical protein COK06_29365 [Bacillus cereus]|nr:hypothetical protein CON40_26440 [Bacillus cereus]PEV95213.1 hypothetical protein CN428_29090 [Bacillus cereus]PFB93107.1 hypothetical protein CN296_26300 [Bacillus cereus]PFE50833.1 hypothetical protein CN318_27620 [Bacillus cereus]PFI29031.1 hypothetical protein COI72_29510 [Bacillus cereus]
MFLRHLTISIFALYFFNPCEKTCLFLLKMIYRKYTTTPLLQIIFVKKGMIYMNLKTSSFELSVSPEFVAAIGQLIVALHLAGIS